MSGHTPGPWRWEVNRSSKSVKLCGGPPRSKFGRYDLTVMDFRRYGMRGAAPVFWDWDYTRLVGSPHRADELAVSVPCREHHANWFADIDHADARLIAAAPELLDALERMTTLFEMDPEASEPGTDVYAAILVAKELIGRLDAPQSPRAVFK